RSKQPGSGIARLFVPGDRTQFCKPKSQSCPGRQGDAEFVHARRQPNRVGKSQTKHLDRQFRRSQKIAQRLADKLMAAGKRQCANAPLMNLLGWLSEKNRSYKIAVKPSHLNWASERLTDRRINKIEAFWVLACKKFYAAAKFSSVTIELWRC